jgi:cholesterol transport system auxiliary component
MMRAVLILMLAALPACGTLGALNDAAAPLPTYELSPRVPDRTVRPRGVLLVEAVTSPASLATDRIVVRPGGGAVATLPGARWSDSAPAQMRALLVRSLAATDGFVLVSDGSAPVPPDLLLLTDLTAFEIVIRDGAPVARGAATLTLVRDADRRVIARRAAAAEVAAGSTDPADAIAALDAVTQSLLSDAMTFVIENR